MRKTPSKQRSNTGVFLTIIKVIMQIIKFFTKKADDKHEQFKLLQIENAKQELRKALIDGRIGDVRYWKEKLKQLSGVILIMFALTGCINTQVEVPVFHELVIGERIIKVNPEDVIKVPKLISPAKQWYLVDDEGLYQWIDIDINNQHLKK